MRKNEGLEREKWQGWERKRERWSLARGNREDAVTNDHFPKNTERDRGDIMLEEGRGREEWLEATCTVPIRDSSFVFVFLNTKGKIPFLTFI